ncbi:MULTISPECIES: hypothetical protein [Streptomyces]|uniref:hypothetical protein n=1 Tax=Streptomyces TaxID=1883 RepID=UPI00163CC85D|nr:MULTISPECIES: hypothetical protein [Streptomyces]MBC2876479.1 hypothetical protein [Streptomyces sp. TYQ1024]UBI40847.1 hypothetical protein K7I03_33210 [Streptomyces mobaraensis]
MTSDGGALTADTVPLDLRPSPDPDRTAILQAELAVDGAAETGTADVRFHFDTCPAGPPASPLKVPMGTRHRIRGVVPKE